MFIQYILYVTRTKRNSIFNLTKINGESLLKYSVGMSGFKGTKKKSSIIHDSAALEFAKKISEHKYNNIQIYFNGRKHFRKQIIFALKKYKIKVSKQIVDVTPMAYNGTKKSKKK